MSESEEHRLLVLAMRDMLSVLYPNGRSVVDVQFAPGHAVPPQIGNFRPDLFIQSHDTTIIGEAKTNKDLGRRHTYDQVACFISHLERSSNGLFVLSASGRGADFAKTVLRFACRDFKSSGVRLAVFDEQDLWMLQSDGIRWRLFDITSQQ